MVKQYESQDEKVNNFLENTLLPLIKEANKDIEFNEVVQQCSLHLNVKEEKIKEGLNRFIKSGKIKEIHIITIPDSEVQDWLNNLVKKDKEVNEELKELEHGKQK